MIEVISSEKFRADIFDYTQPKDWHYQGQPVILNFFATWCGPCKAFAPHLEKVAEAYKDQLTLYKIDVDKSPEVASLFDIRSVPTTVFIVAGDEPAIGTGIIPPADMARIIREVLKVE